MSNGKGGQHVGPARTARERERDSIIEQQAATLRELWPENAKLLDSLDKSKLRKRIVILKMEARNSVQEMARLNSKTDVAELTAKAASQLLLEKKVENAKLVESLDRFVEQSDDRELLHVRTVQLEVENAKLRAQESSWTDGLIEIDDKLGAERSENAKLREYAQHISPCATVEGCTVCTCGLDDVLKENDDE